MLENNIHTTMIVKKNEQHCPTTLKVAAVTPLKNSH